MHQKMTPCTTLKPDIHPVSMGEQHKTGFATHFRSAFTLLQHRPGTLRNRPEGHINRCLLSIFRKRLLNERAEQGYVWMAALITDEAFRKFDAQQEIVASILLNETKRFHSLPVAQTFA
ncbi:hypothetical protein [Uliginosibacterium sediminicola]|uniref:Uncharacterized protein n=1 Tax=Uliginosibacterium sediminicola TaxID=2024550 RepID=A0ABU9YZK4_9RHOO